MLQHQIHRISGQIEGISKMMEEERDCLEIVQQILAARSALARLGKDYLTKEAVRCSRSSQDREKLDAVLKQLFTM